MKTKPMRRYEYAEIRDDEATVEKLDEYGEHGFAIAAVLDGRILLQREIDTGRKHTVVAL